MLKRHRSSDPLDALTPREREMLELMATGASNAGIAESMVIPQSAAEKYVFTVFAKLGSRPQEANHDGVLAVLLFLRA
jgi:DNA-binding NarL/FixJ family response regulator